jgi:2-polyprenyl-6-methoxyphenol hydroxylase-like FAD-dependent oxidoreductase
VRTKGVVECLLKLRHHHRRRVLEALLPFLPTNVTTEFSAHITRVENVPGTAARAAHVRLTIEPSRRDRDTPGAAPDAGAARAFEADAVVGCDGVKSIVRACVGARAASGAPAEMRYTGTYIYRGLVDMEAAVCAGGERVRSPMLLCGPSAVRTRDLDRCGRG